MQIQLQLVLLLGTASEGGERLLRLMGRIWPVVGGVSESSVTGPA